MIRRFTTEIRYHIFCFKKAVQHIVGKYWFRCTILGILIYAFAKRDIAIDIKGDQLNPFHVERNTSLQSKPSHRAQLASTFSYPKAETAEEKRRLQQRIDYIERYLSVAVEERERFGIPASITLAQGLLESNAGKSPLATRNNNHFGIKCFSRTCKRGHCRNFEDDSHKDFFRIYSSSQESFRSHSQLLQSDRYRGLFEIPQSNYKAWARELQRAGYATDPSYANKLIELIEDLGLYRYDQGEYATD